MDTDYKKSSANNAQLFHWFADSPIIKELSAKKTAVKTAVFSFGDAFTSRNLIAITPEPATLPLARRHLLAQLPQLRHLPPHAWTA